MESGNVHLVWCFSCCVVTWGNQTKRVGGDRDADLAHYPMCFPSQSCGDIDASGENEACVDMLQPKPATESTKFQELEVWTSWVWARQYKLFQKMCMCMYIYMHIRQPFGSQRLCCRFPEAKFAWIVMTTPEGTVFFSDFWFQILGWKRWHVLMYPQKSLQNDLAFLVWWKTSRRIWLQYIQIPLWIFTRIRRTRAP